MRKLDFYFYFKLRITIKNKIRLTFSTSKFKFSTKATLLAILRKSTNHLRLKCVCNISGLYAYFSHSEFFLSSSTAVLTPEVKCQYLEGLTTIANSLEVRATWKV